jgi:RNA polymerase sigma-70 factor, ECF subfamily
VIGAGWRLEARERAHRGNVTAPGTSNFVSAFASDFVSQVAVLARSIHVGATETSDQGEQGPLIAALRTRDGEAMHAFYVRYSDRVFGFLYRMTGNRAAADDLHQETWLAVARNVTTLRADSDLAAWLFTIARNKHRSWRRWSLLPDRVATGLDDQTRSDDARSRSLTQEGRPHDLHPRLPAGLRDLETLLSRLSPPLREVLLLVGCEGLAAGQAARVLGLTPEAVRQRVSRARAALRHMMTEAADELANARVRRRKAT